MTHCDWAVTKKDSNEAENEAQQRIKVTNEAENEAQHQYMVSSDAESWSRQKFQKTDNSDRVLALLEKHADKMSCKNRKRAEIILNELIINPNITAQGIGEKQEQQYKEQSA